MVNVRRNRVGVYQTLFHSGRYPAAVSPAAAAALLAEMVRDPMHIYLERLPSPAGSASNFAAIPDTNRSRMLTCCGPRANIMADF